jgi:DNA-binding CsgD family transcriptional regulator
VNDEPRSSPGQKPDLSAATVTPRQAQLLTLLASGYSNKEIAAELGITYGTVKQHLFALFKRLGVANRTKAVLAATQLAKGSPVKKISPTDARLSEVLDLPKYGWRMISVVAVYFSDGLASQPELIIERARYLELMRKELEHCTRALDGRFASMPYGGLLAWFGHPKAHADDADRAARVAMLAHAAARSFPAQTGAAPSVSPSLGTVGIAVASQAEIVAHDAAELLGAEVFRRAAMIARYASGLGVPLADDVTRRLAPLSATWLAISFKDQGAAEQAKRFGTLFALATDKELPVEPRPYWGGLSFLKDVLATVKDGVAQWISVECRPPVMGIVLTDAVGNAAAAEGFKVIRLRLPREGSRALETECLLAQVAYESSGGLGSIAGGSSGSVSANLLVRRLSEACDSAPLAILIYGPKGIDRFVNIIGASGVETLLTKRALILASNMAAAGPSRTSLRLLGPRPKVGSLSRVFSLQQPDDPQMSDRLRLDLQELLDSLSETARMLVFGAATNTRRSFLSLAKIMKLPDQKLKDVLNELTAVGLVVPSATGGFQFRDVNTARAIATLNVAVAKISAQAET